MAVVKADAYGHGAPAVARLLAEAGADYFGVSCLEEALQLRAADISVPVLILGYTSPDMAELLVRQDITQTVISADHARQLSAAANSGGFKIKTHIKIDTGMARLGYNARGTEYINQTAPDIARVSELGGLEIEGIFTHFAKSDDVGGFFTRRQFDLFEQLIKAIADRGINPPLKHCCNTGGLMNFPGMHMDMIRPGLALYGYYPSDKVERKIILRPAMQLKTKISQIKTIAAGTPVSYDGIFTAPKDMTVATLPVGYADGLSRKLTGANVSDNADVLCGGKAAPLIGRVCMDYVMADVSGIENTAEGDTVTVFGCDGDNYISVEDIAAKIGTISYEIICLVGKRVPRVYYDGSVPIETVSCLA
jgi:alanine racemase